MSLDDWNYYGDRRVRAAWTSHAYTYDPAMGVLRPAESLIDDGFDPEYPVRAEAAVCSMCAGHGHVVDPGVDAGGISEPDDAYLHGVYDVTCPTCKGRGLVWTPRFEALPPELRTAIKAYEDEEDDYVSMCLAERRAGC